ncbi:Capsular polysaccharide biosynthesis protein-like protein [Pseudovibrio sp. FO-BEG1]|nr:Capsular polysaccharide biosynthesis protein-like protein [Pseudovibrio sp. FO-BEG1]
MGEVGMRKAPKWRSWMPTSRQLRFKLQSSLARTFPAIGYRYNYFPDNAAPGLAPHKHLITIDERSSRDLPQQVQAFFTEHGALEQSRYPLPITPSGHTQLKLHKLTDTLVLGSTGATVLKSQHRQIEAAAPNTMRFARLKDRTIQSAAINMLGMATGYRHYYHFLCDVAFPLLFLLEHLEPRTFPLKILLREDLPEFQREFYEFLAQDTPLLTLEECRANERIHCKTLYHCSPAMNCEFRAPASEQAASMVATHYLAAYGLDMHKTPTQKLYIARNDAKTRRILNETTLIEQLEARGFQSVVPGKLTHREQVKLFSSAKIIVGTHGAGLTNLLFTQAGGKLVEIFPADYIQSAYAWLSHVRGLEYAPVIGEMSGAHQHFTLPQTAIGQILHEVDASEFA